MTHTPGPWSVRDTNPSGWTYIEPSTGTGGTVAMTRTVDDAHLIASAPELLAACKEAFVYVRSDSAVYPLICQLRAAIDKAEGR